MLQLKSQLKRRQVLAQGFTAAVSCALAIGLSSCSLPSNQVNATGTLNSSASGNSGQGKVLRVGFISTEAKSPIGPEGWAQQKGLWNRELQGLGISEVQFVPFDGGPALNEALASGQLNLGLYGDTPAIVGRSAGLPTHLLNQSSLGQDSWLMTNRADLQSLEDLKGKTLGVAKGTYMHRYLLGLLDAKGLTPTVKIVQIKTADAKVAIERGDIAAYPFALGSGPALLERGFRSIDQASNHDGLVGTSVSIITEATLKQYPDLPKKWNQVRQQALADLRANPEAFYQFALKESGGLSLAAVKASYPLELYPNEPFTDQGLKLLNSTKQFLADQKLLRSDFDIQAWRVANP